MPATGIGLTGREESRPALDAAVGKLRDAGLDVTGIVGDHDPMEAVHEVCPPGSFDEVVVAPLPGESSKWLRADLPQRIGRLCDLPVTHVVARPTVEPHL